ncbi:ATP-binding cassette domain-containing protein [Agromyces protaetiae]|uniref:ATP-binding cassette domain-containing protein n=1 Tax=Agromyces protaetiae TaxID=2509455 RepID=A0A4P6FVW1_9MICO|nr:ATP-binding cassette domain-containing protein [Agromyces protaetiae]QAY74758.1 ATP-binding cassette domain-containing protein [Agromyces protaetiae]
MSASQSTDVPVSQPTARGALAARMRITRGAFSLDVALDVRPGETLALLGPNGAGKSTVLGVLAGLLHPDEGRLELDGRVLVEASADSSRAEIETRPERRGIGLLGQEPRLFPHLTVAQNVAFGPRSAGMPRGDAHELALDWLRRVDLDGFGPRRPAQLSGGQRQRAAIARALAAGPSLLLLDEPFASLDVESVPAIRALLRERLSDTGTSAIVVSHDVLDAVVLADRTAVLDAGRVVDDGPTRDVLASPRSPFTAALAGVNLVAGVADHGAVVARRSIGADVRFTGAVGEDGAPDASEPLADGQPAAAVFRPSSVVVATTRPEGTSLRNVWSDRLVALEPAPSGVRLRFSDPPVAADVTAAAVAELGLAPGQELWLAVKAAEVRVHPLGGGAR